MAERPDLSLVLACYNEASLLIDSVAKIVRTLNLTRFSYEIIFVDDKSSDNTPQLIRALCRQQRNCRAVYHTVNRGRGATVADGFRIATGKVAGYIDVDLEVSPVYIPEMIDQILAGRADVVIGKRIYRTSFSSLPREIFSTGYQWLADYLVGTGKLDTETGYKFFRRTKLPPLLSKAKHPHWFWDTEIMVYARRKGLTIVEIPVLFLRRYDKQSSVRLISDIMDYLVNLWRLRRKLTRHP